MKKIFTIFILICLFTSIVSVVFGSSNFDYNRLKFSIEILSGSSDGLIADLALMQGLTTIIKSYDPDAKQYIYVSELDGKVVGVYFYNGALLDDGSFNVPALSDMPVIIDGISIDGKYYDILSSAFSWFSHEQVSDNKLTQIFQIVKFFVGCLIGVVYILFLLVFSIIDFAWGMILSFLYLLGFIESPST